MYGIFDVALDSDIPLPELPKCTPSDKIIAIRGVDSRELKLQKVDWFYNWVDQNNEVCINCGRIDGNYILQFPNLADFIISEHGALVQYLPKPDIPIETVRHLLLDQVIPRVLGQQGRLVIHASAVTLPNRKTIAFLGNSGQGKSTTASYFCKKGAQLITDDCLLIEAQDKRVSGIPSYYGLRLSDDSINATSNEKQEYSPVSHYSDKKRLFPNDADSVRQNKAQAIDAFFLLENQNKNKNNYSNNVSIEPINGSNSLMAMIEKMFVLDTTHKHNISYHFKSMGRVISTGVPLYKLELPHKYSLLPIAKEQIDSLLK